jgi:NADPH:quinone reductase-like Zn-dependent oxidoreductase
LSDWEGLSGAPFYVRLFGLFRPRFSILGTDLAGSVVSLGAGATRFAVGDDVYGDALGTRGGGFAEYACVPEKLLNRKPAKLSFDEVSTVPQAGIIALQGLGWGRSIGPGSKVLINGAGGGSGMFAIQMAKAWGAEVTAVDSSQKFQHMKNLGADFVIDYNERDYTKGPERYDWILDLVGTHSLFSRARALKAGGVYKMVGGKMNSLLSTLLLGPLVGGLSKKTVGILAANCNADDLSTIIKMIEDGVVRLVIDTRSSLSAVPDAVALVGAGGSMGKIVVSIS